MNIIQVTQGSQEWHKLRANHFTASEAPAMMGDSKYQTRGDLLRQKATGETKDVSPAQQRIFDKGHAAEEAARPLAEDLIGEELYPITATAEIEGLPLLASFDGLTLMHDIAFEHKLFNQSLVARVQAGDLEPHYYWQLEQQLLVADAERAVFVCSDGTADNFYHCEYTSVPDRREALINGWKQFAKDLSTYQAPEVAEVVEAEPVRDLPAITYRMDGLTLNSNFDVFKEAALALVEQSQQPIETDQDFANAEAQVKIFKKAETKIKALSEQVLGEVQSIDTFVKDLKFIGEQIRQARLATDKQVKNRKDEIRLQILTAADRQIGTYEKEIEAQINAPISAKVSVADAMKGKKTVTSLKEAADTAVAQAKIEIDGLANIAKTNKAYLEGVAPSYGFLFNDWSHIAFLEGLAFQGIVDKRITDHKAAEDARLEDERARIRAEEEAKAKAKADAEAKAKMEAEGKAAHPVAEAKPVMEVPEDLFEGAKPASQLQPSTKQQLDAGMVSIAMREYRHLQARDAMLSALEAAGVDNWQGYDEAMATLTDNAA